jgi:hypothetical protein
MTWLGFLLPAGPPHAHSPPGYEPRKSHAIPEALPPLASVALMSDVDTPAQFATFSTQNDFMSLRDPFPSAPIAKTTMTSAANTTINPVQPIEKHPHPVPALAGFVGAVPWTIGEGLFGGVGCDVAESAAGRAWDTGGTDPSGRHWSVQSAPAQ